MKVIVLGGAGDMGSEAVRELVQFPEIERITIADLNTAAAEKLASSLGRERVKVQKVDATSHQDLVNVIKGHTVAAGALGPFYRFEKPIVEATLEAGVDYVSVCDDNDAVSAVIQMDRTARDKGRKVLTGMGWTPGLSNILARKGYDALKKTESIRIYWAGSAGDSTGLAVTLHAIHIFSGLVPSYQRGKTVEIKAGSEKEVVEFPLPLGRVHTYHLGHPEPVTMPLYLQNVKEVVLKGGLVENYLNNLTILLSSLGLTNTPAKKQALGKVMKALLPLLPVNKEKAISGIRVEVTGSRDEKKVRLIYTAVDHMRRLTSIPLGIGTYMMGRGEIKRYGVFAPEAEGAINTDTFLQALSRRGIKVESREEKL
jgi:saccharopine dehydrogenase-like NADP-dependent oxidoreductase